MGHWKDGGTFNLSYTLINPFPYQLAFAHVPHCSISIQLHFLLPQKMILLPTSLRKHEPLGLNHLHLLCPYLYISHEWHPSQTKLSGKKTPLCLLANNHISAMETCFPNPPNFAVYNVHPHFWPQLSGKSFILTF